MIITYSVRVFVALVTQHARRMRRMSVASPALLYIFPRNLKNGAILGKEVIEYKMCLLGFSTSIV